MNDNEGGSPYCKIKFTTEANTTDNGMGTRQNFVFMDISVQPNSQSRTLIFREDIGI